MLDAVSLDDPIKVDPKVYIKLLLRVLAGCDLTDKDRKFYMSQLHTLDRFPDAVAAIELLANA